MLADIDAVDIHEPEPAKRLLPWAVVQPQPGPKLLGGEERELIHAIGLEMPGGTNSP